MRSGQGVSAHFVVFLAALGIGAAGGCAGPGLSLDEISEAPIALVYWDAATARRRQELLEEMEARGAPSGPSRAGVARLEGIAGAVGLQAGSSAGLKIRDFPGRIALLNPRTLEVKPFPSAPPNARPLAWSGDHTRLLFNSSHQDGGRSQIYEHNEQTGSVLKLTHGPAYHLEGAYGPQGQLLITWVEVEKDRRTAGLDIRPPAGGVGQPILEGVYPSSPKWSPDGEEIIYVRSKATNPRKDRSEIVSQAPELDAEVDALARGREPVFTPDGDSIIYSAQTAQGWKLRRMRSDGSGRAAVGRSVRDERWPAVSPDGRHVVYVSNEAGFDQLYIRRIDGSGDRILLKEGSVAFPVW